MTDKLREASEREVFEAWAKEEYPGLEVRVQNLLGTYTKGITEWLATGWFARAALAQQDAQAVPTQRQYEMALRQWDHWKSYALELQAKLVKYEGGSPMVLNAAPTPPAQRVMLTDDEIDVLWAKQQTKPFKTHGEDRMDFARAVIEAYENKNGLKP